MQKHDQEKHNKNPNDQLNKNQNFISDAVFLIEMQIDNSLPKKENTYFIENVIDISCCFCRCFHKEKAILLRIYLCILHPIIYNKKNAKTNSTLATQNNNITEKHKTKTLTYHR